MTIKEMKNTRNSMSRIEKAESKINKIRNNICQKRYFKIKMRLIFILLFMLVYTLYLIVEDISYEDSFMGSIVAAFLLYTGYLGFKDYYFHEKINKRIEKIKGKLKKNYSN